MSNNNLKLNLILKAYDTMSGVIKSACTQSDKAFEKMNKTLEETANKFDSAGKASLKIGGVLTGISAINAKTAGDFEQGMNNISTLIDTNNESIKAMGNEILSIAKNSPKAISDLTDALYSIRSAGISASEQFNVLKGSEMLAVSGLATTAEAVDIATSAINAFSLEGKEANQIYDMFFKVVKYGKTNVSEFAQGFGSVAGVVSSANIKLDEYSASIAAMTTMGVKANIAHTQMKAVIAGLSRSTDDQVKIFNKLGAKSFKDLINKSGGMVNALSKVKEAVGGSEAKIISLVGSVEAYNAVMSLTGATNKVYLQTLNDMRNGGESITEAYAKQVAGLNNAMATIKNNIQALSIKFGTALLPTLQTAGNLIKGVTGLIDKMPNGLVNFISVATAGIGTFALFGGAGLVAIGSVIKNFILLRKVMRSASILTWANPAILPIAGVVAGIVALGAGALYCYNKFEGFRNICQGTWAVIKAGGAWLAVLTNSFINGAIGFWKFISPAVKFGLTVASWITPIGWVYHAISGLVKIIGNLIQKAGGLRAIGSALKSWGKNAETKAEEINNSVKNQRNIKKVDGSHYNGLNYVPFDGYIAQVHKGEAILTKPQADRWRNKKTLINNNSSNSANMVLNYNPTVVLKDGSEQSKNDFLKLLKEHKEELLKLIQIQLRRCEARSY